MSRRHVNDHRAQSTEDPVYDDAHRAFLQAFFANSIFTIDTLKPVIASILQAQGPWCFVNFASSTPQNGPL